MGLTTHISKDESFDLLELDDLSVSVGEHSISWAYAFKNLLFFCLEQFKHQLTHLSITNTLYENFNDDGSHLMGLFMHVITDALNTISLPRLTSLILRPINHYLAQLD